MSFGDDYSYHGWYHEEELIPKYCLYCRNIDQNLCSKAEVFLVRKMGWKNKGDREDYVLIGMCNRHIRDQHGPERPIMMGHDKYETFTKSEVSLIRELFSIQKLMES